MGESREGFRRERAMTGPHRMAAPFAFSDVVTTVEQLRDVIGPPGRRALDKELTELDNHARAFISTSSFVLVASSDGQGRMDISPKGDACGFVRVLDDRTLAIPDRPGNRRADTFTNVLRNPGVGLLFLIPGKLETLRVGGRASIVRDPGLREQMAVQGKIPHLALVVTVERLFFHCAKCTIRSQLWSRESWPDLAGLPSHARCIADHAGLTETIDEVQASLDRNYGTQLY